MEDFVIELAGVPIRVRCQFEENREFLKDYHSEKEALFIIEPTADDLKQMQDDFDRMDEAEGNPQFKRSDSFLENNAIHALLAEKLVEYNVLLMHGSALCMDGQGIIFTASSGTGKSTHARLWREVYGERVWMVNDDKPLISIREDSIRVWGTPWDGKHRLSRNASAPLRAIVSLERDSRNWIRPLRKSDVFPVLMKQCFTSRNAESLSRILDLEKRLLEAVEFYRLGCNIEPEAAKVAWEGINAK